jgi:branched-chain amino acid transport system ATP-binding protein
MPEDDIFSLFPNLRTRCRHLGGQLSGGEQQMLAIARILRSGARTLLLDEPTEGLAPIIIRQIESALIELKRRGYTILLVEQNLDFVLHLADRVVAVEDGAIVENLSAIADGEVRTRLAGHLAL